MRLNASTNKRLYLSLKINLNQPSPKFKKSKSKLYKKNKISLDDFKKSISSSRIYKFKSNSKTRTLLRWKLFSKRLLKTSRLLKMLDTKISKESKRILKEKRRRLLRLKPPSTTKKVLKLRLKHTSKPSAMLSKRTNHKIVNLALRLGP
jgi:hypothetical protein